MNTDRFDAGLKTVRAELERRGMKLGLWFSPNEAALTSRLAMAHSDCVMNWQGKDHAVHPVWETEDSFNMCIVSRYWERFADELIRLCREAGVTYFKWDALHQYGCSSPRHQHGTTEHSMAERGDSYAFEQVRYLSKIIDRVCSACPEAIIDFDVTEAHRAVGLAFLASGKFFLMNNGPYYRCLDDRENSPNGGIRSNVLVFPGKARARNCRATLDLDRWIPSILFLVHYLPDAPAYSQALNIASLVLGHNGIWGDLVGMNEEGIAQFGYWLSRYKAVRDDITLASPVQSGFPGGSPEVHEKINRATGRGAVSMFAPFAGTYEYVTRNAVDARWAAMPSLHVERLPDGCARIIFEAPAKTGGGAVVFFGVQG